MERTALRLARSGIDAVLDSDDEDAGASPPRAGQPGSTERRADPDPEVEALFDWSRVDFGGLDTAVEVQLPVEVGEENEVPILQDKVLEGSKSIYSRDTVFQNGGEVCRLQWRS